VITGLALAEPFHQLVELRLSFPMFPLDVVNVSAHRPASVVAKMMLGIGWHSPYGSATTLRLGPRARIDVRVAVIG
jgi:hypothetical protein